MIYNLVEISTGENVSQSSQPILDVRDGFKVIETADNKGIWNSATLSFGPIPAKRRVSQAEFYKTVGMARFGALIAAAKNDVQLEALVAYVRGLSIINKDDPETIYGMNLIVSKEVWTQADIDEILS